MRGRLPAGGSGLGAIATRNRSETAKQARQTRFQALAFGETPIALGEQIYTAAHFREFVHAGAVHYVQPDVVRLAGVTEFLEVADVVQSHNLPGAPHVGDMAQVHQHLCFTHPACNLLEYIPWLRDWMEHPARIQSGYYLAPDAPGAGTTPNQRAFKEINQA